jgi:membrane-bound lytic murein transglycosylase D
MAIEMKYRVMCFILLFSYLWEGKVMAEAVTVHRVYGDYFHAVKIKQSNRAACNLSCPKDLQRKLNHAIDNGYLAFVLAKLDECHLPLALAFIPLIESNYNEKALSPKGAGGLWQLMPKTASQLGLNTQDRFALHASTLAALQHLQNLYSEFGSWSVAVAAYNAGSYRVKEALRQLPGASLEKLHLPQGTKAYVRQFRLLQQLMPNPLL